MSCPICCRDGESEFTCYHCQGEACYSCAGRFITDNVTVHPRCMFCVKELTRDFVLRNFPKPWVKNLFYPYIGVYTREKERQLLPYSQEEASLQLQIKSLNKELRKMPTKRRLLDKHKKDPNISDIVAKHDSDKMKIWMKIDALKLQSVDFRILEVKTAPIVKFKCPMDNCRGFVNQDNVCILCRETFCVSCRECSGVSHRCDPDVVENIKNISTETKPCPKCYISIFKLSGCDQMFCTQCQCVFSWSTGKVESGAVHNPHYFDWILQHQAPGVDLETIACGEIPDALQFARLVKGIHSEPAVCHKLMQIYRFRTHLERVVMPAFEAREDHFDLRVAYLMSEFDDDKWAMKLANREKKNMKILAYRDLLNTTLVIMSDLIRRVCFNKDVENVLTTFKEFHSFFNGQSEDIVKFYGGAVPGLIEELMV